MAQQRDWLGQMSPQEFIDLSHPLEPGMPVYPGDPPFEIEVLQESGGGPAGTSILNCSAMRTGLHAGTHMDAPFHFAAGKETIDRVPLEQCMGPALLIDLSRITDGEIAAAHLEPYRVVLGEIRKAVLRTGWSRLWGTEPYFSAHPCLSAEAARLLVACSVHLVGVDMPSVDREPYPAHRELLGSGVVILENLTKLEALPTGVFHLTALPLAIAGRDGSPVRAVAARLNGGGQLTNAGAAASMRPTRSSSS